MCAKVSRPFHLDIDFFCFLRQGLDVVAQASVELLGSSDPPASSSGVTDAVMGAYHCAQPNGH